MFTFSHSLGIDYTGQWVSPYTFEITVVDPAGSAVAVGQTTVSAGATTPILDYHNASLPANTTSPMLDGSMTDTFAFTPPVIPTQPAAPPSFVRPQWATIYLFTPQANGGLKTSTYSSGGYAFTQQRMIVSGDGYIQFKTPKQRALRYVSILDATGTNTLTRLDFGGSEWVNEDPRCYINCAKEELPTGIVTATGNYVSPKNFYTDTTVFRVTVSGGNVLFSKDGTTFKQVTGIINASHYPLQIKINMHPAQWSGRVGSASETVYVNDIQLGGGFIPKPAAPVINGFAVSDPDPLPAPTEPVHVCHHH